MTDNFADHPRSIGEIKAEKSEEASAWSPRDVLIDVLRDIDAGKIKPDSLVVCYRNVTDNGQRSGHFRQSGSDLFVTLGLLTRIVFRLQERDD